MFDGEIPTFHDVWCLSPLFLMQKMTVHWLF